MSEALAAVREAARSAVSAGELPAFLAELERVRVEAVLSASQIQEPSHAPQAGVLSVPEAAKRLGRSKWWVYRHKASLPLVRFPTGGYGISTEGLEKFIRKRTS